MSNVNYSFTTNEEGVLNFKSEVTSFGLSHVTEKDIRSFYAKFSEMAYFDTGLLPVDGSGMLSIRTAGPHTQIGYQHAPGMYYINWGKFEGDSSAKKYYVAQPYRIVIADIYNGNILGARMFYSPIPIQHPSTPLYHVNLPNINCKGYRGNGVGWICLYHNEDISSYPFGEKVSKILERCSGVEAYNDANMSETDGPRFYRDNGKPNYIWDPQKWEDHSEKDGVNWTLDPDLLIPVLVHDMDHQDKHYSDGQPLTYADAILGDYQAYYTDPIRPKPVNAIVRGLTQFDNGTVFNWFKQSYNSSKEISVGHTAVDPFSSTEQVRITISKAAPVFVNHDNSDDEDEENENIYVCDWCGDCEFDTETDNYLSLYNGQLICDPCSSHAIHVEHLDAYFSEDDEEIEYVPFTDQYYYMPKWNYKVKCESCGSAHPYDTPRGYGINMVPIYENDTDTVCTNCAPTKACACCGKHTMPANVGQLNIPTIKNFSTNSFETSHVCNACYNNKVNYIEKCLDLKENTILQCVCGKEAEAQFFQNVSKNHYFDSLGFIVHYDNFEQLHQLITQNYQIISSYETLETGNKNSTEYKEEQIALVKANPHFYGYFIKVDQRCPDCFHTSIVDGSDPVNITITVNNLINTLSNTEKVSQMISNQSDGKIAGLTVQCQASF